MGGPDSAAPIRVGVSDRAAVISRIGRPGVDPANGPPVPRPLPVGDFWEYEHLYVESVTLLQFWPPHEADWFRRNYYPREDWLALWFGPDGKVRKYEVWSRDGEDSAPPDVLAEEHRVPFGRDTPATQP